MTAIALSNTTVLANAPPGTVVGVFNAAVTLVSSPSGYFRLQGTNLVTAWSTPLTPGAYLVLVSSSSGTASFLVSIVQAPAVPVITLNPSAVTIADNSVAYAKLADLSVTMSDGSAFSGVLTIDPSSLVSIFRTRIVLARALTAADDGAHTVTVSAGSVTASLTVTVVAPPPPLTMAITFTPLQSSVDDTVSVGTMVAQTVVSMSDGSVFNGTYSMADSTGLFTVNGSGGILTVRAVTVADDGVHHLTVTATTPAGLTASARFPA